MSQLPNPYALAAGSAPSIMYLHLGQGPIPYPPSLMRLVDASFGGYSPQVISPESASGWPEGVANFSGKVTFTCTDETAVITSAWVTAWIGGVQQLLWIAGNADGVPSQLLQGKTDLSFEVNVFALREGR